MSTRIAVIGAGAAGCFGAIGIKRLHPEYDVCVYEGGPKPLMKVALTGGGRCNLTNTFEDIDKLRDAYPRGEQLMKRALRAFSQWDVMEWFEKEGVRLTVQPDRCVFPVSQDAMQIVRTLENLLRRLGVPVQCGRRLVKLTPLETGYELEFNDGKLEMADKVFVTAGGTSSDTLRRMLPADVEVMDTVPSLFTFKIPDAGLRSLMGTVVEDVEMGICGTSFRSHGTLLLTDWGVSGPATLKLSSYAARHLAEHAYRAELSINWMRGNEEQARALLGGMARDNQKRYIAGTHPDFLTDRLWRHIVQRAGIRSEQRWSELGGKGMSRLANMLVSDTYPIEGRAKFKEEFVTCGGVSLNAININTLECKAHPGLFFAGEVLDLDAITGGFNLQAAWSTAAAVMNNV